MLGSDLYVFFHHQETQHDTEISSCLFPLPLSLADWDAVRVVRWYNLIILIVLVGVCAVVQINVYQSVYQ